MKKVTCQFLNTAAVSLIVTAAVLTAFSTSGCGGSNNSAPNYSNLVGTKSVPAGSWGSTSGELDITSTTITFANRCGSDTLNGSITPDANGDFMITGGLPSNRPIPNAIYSGHAQYGVMTLNVTDTSNNVLGTYTLAYGVSGKVVFTSCP